MTEAYETGDRCKAAIPLLLLELRRLHALDHLLVAHRKLVAHLEGCAHHRLVVQPAEEDALSVVAGIHHHPHPLALAGPLVLELSLDVVAGLELCYSWTPSGS